MSILLRKFFSLLFALGLCLNVYSQRQDLIGINVNGEVYPGRFRPSVGLTLERRVLRHSGFETGIFYRTSKLSEYVTYIDASGYYSYSFIVLQRYLTIPVLYKYYSKILNFSVGPTVDFYLGWKQKNNGSSVHINSVDVDHKVNLGFLVKAGKIIPLSKQFLLEPELRFGSVRALDEVSLGIGIAGKYRF